MGLGLFGNGAVIIGVHVNLVTQTINLSIFNVFVFAVIVVLVFPCISGTTSFVSVGVGTLFR